MEGGLTSSKGAYFWGRQIPYRETMRVAGLTAAGEIALPPRRFQRISAQNLFLFRHQDQWKKWSQKEQEGIFLISCFLKLYLSICKWWTFFFLFCYFQFTGTFVGSDLSNYSDNFLFIISHSRESLWTIKPVNLRLHINQWNIIASCIRWASGTLYMPGYIQLASRFA